MFESSIAVKADNKIRFAKLGNNNFQSFYVEI